MAEARVTRHETPLSLMRQWSDEMDRLFATRSSWWPEKFLSRLGTHDTFVPELEVLTRNGNLVVRADLPGIEQKDIKVELADGALTISGERRQEKEEKGDQFYRCERSYGSFSRSIPLPEGAHADQAAATFKNGVLEVTMPAPAVEPPKARQLEVKTS